MCPGGRPVVPVWSVGHPGAVTYARGVLRLRRLLLVTVLAVGAALVWRRLNASRAPERRADEGRPVIGSLDAWPAVPRAPAA